MKIGEQNRSPYPLGAHAEGEEVRFSFVSKTDSCGILIYDRATGRRLKKLAFLPEERIGNVYNKIVAGLKPEAVSYQFYEGDSVRADRHARAFAGKASYGRMRSEAELKACFPSGDFRWGEDKRPRIPYSRAVVYCLHVRGFTRHASSGVKERGTFAGIEEKIPYLKEMGVTTLELQPAYEFLEAEAREESPQTSRLFDGEGRERLNYWGYKRGFYYAPKAAYAAGEPSGEFKSLIKALHENGMELVMQFYFPGEVNVCEIQDVLRFWALEYHVDGFHLMGEGVRAELAAADDLLADTKLWYYRFDPGEVYGNGQPSFPHIAEYNDGWQYDMRRFLKGDENMLDRALCHMRRIPDRAGCIHYLTNYCGFTLADLVSYDYKHNEANGEENRDGNDHNCSWNCGEEGATRKSSVKKLRVRQIKNAMCLLMLSQSTPLIFMGDEFGNSQRGNNNPYCQDNAVTWLDWSCLQKNEELASFWRLLADFRREHPVLCPDREPMLMDSMACGYPDLSYHGECAWRPRTDSRFRHIGLMLCGSYAKKDENRDDDFIYIAVNMHWTEHGLALPRLPRGMRWERAFATGGEEESEAQGEEELMRKIPPRSISVFLGRQASRKERPARGRKETVSE